MIVKGFKFIQPTIYAGKPFPRIVNVGVVTEDEENGILVFRNFVGESSAMPWSHPQVIVNECQGLAVEWAQERGYYVELDLGGETHNEDDDGEAWKRG